MAGIQIFAKKHYILFSILLTLIYVGVCLSPILFSQKFVLAITAGIRILFLLLLILFIWLCRWPFSLHIWRWSRLLVCMAGLGVLGMFVNWFAYACAMERGPAPAEFLGYLLQVAVIVFTEEMLYRGVMIRLIRDHAKQNGLFRGVIVVSGIFALTHIPGALFGILDVFQVFLLFGFGMYAAALFLRSDSIWLGIILHLLYYFSTSLSYCFSDTGTSLLSLPVRTVLAGCVALAMLVSGLIFLGRCCVEIEERKRGVE
jgi:membrane protease YdiL (CAAX protease family)